MIIEKNYSITATINYYKRILQKVIINVDYKVKKWLDLEDSYFGHKRSDLRVPT